jgi:hypothetical protein
MFKRLHVKYPLFLSDFNKNCVLSTGFRIKLKYQVSPKSFQWEPSFPCRQTDMTKLIVAFRNFAKAPKNAFLRSSYRLAFAFQTIDTVDECWCNVMHYFISCIPVKYNSPFAILFPPKSARCTESAK